MPHTQTGSDRLSRLDVGSLAADSPRVRLLAGLSEEERSSILEAAAFKRFPRHSVVTNQGATAGT